MSGFKIEVPQDYFARIAAKEYSDDAGMAVIREFAQNSTDAGATRVEFTFSGSGLGARLFVRDNGRGCSAETVRTKLLTPLGTQKEAEAIGGFGKAKELLFFANPEWTIRTRNVQVTGSFLTVSSFENGMPFVEGFEAIIQLPPALHQAAWNASHDFLRRSERPGVEWFLNSKRITCDVVRGKRAVKDFGFCKAYLNTEIDNDSTIYLRTGGLLTSARYGYHAGIGQVVIEVTGASSELLTPARDWFRASQHRQAVEGWLNQLVTNARQTLADEVGDELRFQDMEPVEQLTEEQLKTIARRNAVPMNNGIETKMEFSKHVAVEGLLQNAQEAAGFLNAVDPHHALDPADELEGRVVTRPARRRASDGFDMSLLPVIPGALRLTLHTGGKKRGAVGMKWLRKNPEAARKILAGWATAVRVVATLNNLPVDAVGFTFVETTHAEFFKTDNRFTLMINPMSLDLSASDLAEELIDRALHETAHLVHGSGHSEAFVYGEYELRRKVRGAQARGVIARALRTSEVQSIEVMS